MDNRIHVGYSELFADDIDNPLTAQEIQQYINELRYRQCPVLKDITIFDYEYALCHDIDDSDYDLIHFIPKSALHCFYNQKTSTL